MFLVFSSHPHFLNIPIFFADLLCGLISPLDLFFLRVTSHFLLLPRPKRPQTASQTSKNGSLAHAKNKKFLSSLSKKNVSFVLFIILLAKSLSNNRWHFFDLPSLPGVGKVRPEGQIRPAEAQRLACDVVFQKSFLIFHGKCNRSCLNDKRPKLLKIF